jgi:hypothetical protein
MVKGALLSFSDILSNLNLGITGRVLDLGIAGNDTGLGIAGVLLDIIYYLMLIFF